VDTIFQTGSLDVCPFATNRSAPIIGIGSMTITLSNPYGRAASISIVVTLSPPDEVTGLLNLTEAQYGFQTGDPNNFIQNEFIGPETNAMFSIPIASSDVHWMQIFTRTLSNSCSAALATSISYDSTFVDNSAAVTTINLEFDSDILSNYQSGDLSVAKGLQNVQNALTLTTATLGNTLVSVSTNLAGLGLSLAGVIDGQNSLINQFANAATNVQIVYNGHTVPLQTAVQNISDLLALQNKTLADSNVLLDSVLAGVSPGIEGIVTSITNLEAQVAAKDVEVTEQLAEGRATADQAEATALAAQTALSLLQTPEVFYMTPVGAQMITDSWWYVGGLILTLFVAGAGLGLSIYNFCLNQKERKLRALGGPSQSLAPSQQQQQYPQAPQQPQAQYFILPSQTPAQPPPQQPQYQQSQPQYQPQPQPPQQQPQPQPHHSMPAFSQMAMNTPPQANNFMPPPPQQYSNPTYDDVVPHAMSSPRPPAPMSLGAPSHYPRQPATSWPQVASQMYHQQQKFQTMAQNLPTGFETSSFSASEKLRKE